MNKYKAIYGVDVSKDYFDVYSSKEIYLQFENSINGFKLFKTHLTKKVLIVIEATGYYHFCLAQFFYNKGYLVSVVNPLSVKRFIQMKLSKIKTDKADAKAICEYAQVNNVPLYVYKNKILAECLQLYRLIDVYLKQRTAIKNKIHGENVLGNPSKKVQESLQKSLKILEKEIVTLENYLIALVENHYINQLELLKSIPGIGNKTALLLILETDGFTRFQNASQLSSYVGITPTIRQSGSSVRGKSRISKIGNRKLRNLLFLCSFNACKYNFTCVQLYERLVGKGKSKKLALIAVSNKLIKQAFAIATTGNPYDEAYVYEKNN